MRSKTQGGKDTYLSHSDLLGIVGGSVLFCNMMYDRYRIGLMFGFSFGEILVISVVALLVLGPERIPQVARTLGRLFAELRRATDEVKREFNYSEFTRNNSPFNLNLPQSTGLRAEPLVIEQPLQPAPEIEPIPNCEESNKPETTKS